MSIDGDIIFSTPNQEIMRFTGDGQILVKGHPVTTDKHVVAAFRRWLGNVGLIPQISPAPIIILKSGLGAATAKGGDFTLINNSQCVCPSLIHGHQADCQYG